MVKLESDEYSKAQNCSKKQNRGMVYQFCWQNKFQITSWMLSSHQNDLLWGKKKKRLKTRLIQAHLMLVDLNYPNRTSQLMSIDTEIAQSWLLLNSVKQEQHEIAPPLQLPQVVLSLKLKERGKNTPTNISDVTEHSLNSKASSWALPCSAPWALPTRENPV